MRCDEVFEQLEALSRAEDRRYCLMSDLLRAGLVEEVPAGENGVSALEGLKEELLKVKSEFRQLRQEPQGSSKEQNKERLKARELELRRKVLNTVQNARSLDVIHTDQGDVTLTYQGREALQVLESRMPAAGEWEWETLSNNLDRLGKLLAAEAQEAAQILKFISPSLKSIDEYHLRAAAVGLASVPGDPLTKANRFTELVLTMRNSMRINETYAVLGAEAAVSKEQRASDQGSNYVTEVAQLLRELSDSMSRPTPTQRSVASLLMSRPKDERQDLWGRIQDEERSVGNLLGAALLVLECEDSRELTRTTDRYHGWEKELGLDHSGDANDITVAAALLATAKEEPAIVAEKYRLAQSYMQRLFDEQMLTASATIANWPTSVEESFDNLRLAASQILQHKLSLGGVENFSLGMKLLTNNAQFVRTRLGSAMGLAEDLMDEERIVGSGEMSQAAGTSAVSLVASSLLFRTTFSVFHALTLQKKAQRDFKYHPVHTSFLYG